MQAYKTGAGTYQIVSGSPTSPTNLEEKLQSAFLESAGGDTTWQVVPYLVNFEASLNYMSEFSTADDLHIQQPRSINDAATYVCQVTSHLDYITPVGITIKGSEVVLNGLVQLEGGEHANELRFVVLPPDRAAVADTLHASVSNRLVSPLLHELQKCPQELVPLWDFGAKSGHFHGLTPEEADEYLLDIREQVAALNTQERTTLYALLEDPERADDFFNGDASEIINASRASNLPVE